MGGDRIGSCPGLHPRHRTGGKTGSSMGRTRLVHGDDDGVIPKVLPRDEELEAADDAVAQPQRKLQQIEERLLDPHSFEDEVPCRSGGTQVQSNHRRELHFVSASQA